jgi:hypothetical protein
MLSRWHSKQSKEAEEEEVECENEVQTSRIGYEFSNELCRGT